MRKTLSLLLALSLLLGLGAYAVAEEPLAISLYYSDNATLPFKQD